MSASFGAVIETKRIIVCVGSGGVGKTTTAACFGIEAARRGKRALVLTIDPAKRLANSLGLKELGHQPQEIPKDRLEALGGCVEGGSLHAMMLDQKEAFDEMVETYATDAKAVRRILANPLYRQISERLTGAQEHAALTTLQALERNPDYDVIVVDTPPTSHALDFLDAPKKLSEAIDSPAIEWFRKMQEGGSLALVGKTGTYMMKKLAKFVGSQLLEDVALFFTEFNDILGGFKERAEEIYAVLHRSDVGFVIVASPEQLAVNEALFFHERLAKTTLPFSGFAVNKVHCSESVQTDHASLVAALSEEDNIQALGLQKTSLDMASHALLTAHEELQCLATSDRLAIERLRKAAPKALLLEVPFFARDVHQVENLATLRDYLFAS